jgi:hypothetical protein
MRNSLKLFNSNMKQAREISALYDYLAATVAIPHQFDDLLRSQLVYAVSAFDKLIHDLVRIGMVQSFMRVRPPTGKYLSEPVSMQVHIEMVQATIPPKEHVFEQTLFRKFKAVSFQDPAKIADGLSYIWDESQKWQKIAASLGMSDAVVRTRLKLIADRRNAIVHEADIDPSTNTKFPIGKAESEGSLDFLAACGNSIANLVT